MAVFSKILLGLFVSFQAKAAPPNRFFTSIKMPKVGAISELFIFFSEQKSKLLPLFYHFSRFMLTLRADSAGRFLADGCARYSLEFRTSRAVRAVRPLNTLA